MGSRTHNHTPDTGTSRKDHSFDNCHTRAHTDRRKHTDRKSFRSNYRSPDHRKPTASNRGSTGSPARRRSRAAMGLIRGAPRFQPLVFLPVAALLDSAATASKRNPSTRPFAASPVARPGSTPQPALAPA